jgi:hypothetical protein
MNVLSNSAIAAQLNIRAQKGDNFERVFKFWTDSSKTVPIDITDIQFLIQVLSSNQSIILDFTPVITAPNILTISQTNTAMNIPAISYSWYIKEIGTNTLTIISGYFQLVDGAGNCESSDLDVVINNCEQTIDVDAIIGGNSIITPEEISIAAGDANPTFIDISEHPLFDKYADILYKELNDAGGYDRQNDLQITENYMGSDFIGFTVTGHGINTWLKDSIIVLKK